GVAVFAPAALIGGLIGAKIALKVRDDVLRWLVVVLGVGVGIYLIIRAVRGGCPTYRGTNPVEYIFFMWHSQLV
ncbi:MAG: hypothetical protein ACR2I1_05720, partial [Propionibacteriaceae bacterium]